MEDDLSSVGSDESVGYLERMGVDLQSSASIDKLGGRAMFDVLKATIQYPVNPQAKAAKLTDDMIFFCRNPEDPDNNLWIMWRVVIYLAQCIPPEHEWQDSLIQSIHSLRLQGGRVSEKYEGVQSMEWSSLPDLCMDLSEAWNGPYNDKEGLSVGIVKWKNFNSFVARLTRTDWVHWINFPVWQLRDALEEEPRSNTSIMECDVWVAADWIIYCTQFIFDYMKPKEGLDVEESPSYRVGSLCEGIPQHSMERWWFWKKRFSELAANGDDVGIGAHVSDVSQKP